MGDVNGTMTKGKKSSVSAVSSLLPYISFMVGSQNASLMTVRMDFSLPFVGFTIPMKNLGGIPNLSTPSIYALITFKCIRAMNSSLNA
jgi:hypothetical protein